MKKIYVLLIVLIMTVFMTACSDDNDNEETQDNADEVQFEVTDDEVVDKEQVVLTINEEDVLGEVYNPVYYQTKMQMYSYGMDISNLDDVKDQTYSQLIAQELIRQDAINKGLEIAEEAVDTTIDGYKQSEGEEGFEAYLEQFDLTEESFREQIKFNLLVDKYINDVIEIEEVTEDEIQETYDQLKEESEDMMDFEEAKPIIEQQLVQQKQAEQLQAKIDELEEDASIEKLL